MIDPTPRPLASPLCVLLALLVVLPSFMGCADEARVLDLREDPSSEESVVQEPLTFTDTAYKSSFQGPDSIAEVLALIDKGAPVWHGFSPATPYPVKGDCDFDRSGEQVTNEIAALPMVIEGVVTLHPRYFVKQAICGEDERFYGSFFIQDHSGGILVLRDSRISPFSYGDVVRMRVTGVAKYFDAFSVLTFDQLEVVSEQKIPLAYETTTNGFRVADQGLVRRIRGKIVSESTNNNFNEMRLESLDDPAVSWLVSLDRELGQRRPELFVGDVVELTGPVTNSFGLRMLIASYGQIERIK